MTKIKPSQGRTSSNVGRKVTREPVRGQVEVAEIIESAEVGGEVALEEIVR